MKEDYRYLEFNPTFMEALRFINDYKGFEISYKFIDKNKIVIFVNWFEIFLNGSQEIAGTVYISEPLNANDIQAERIYFDYIKKFLDTHEDSTIYEIDEEEKFEQLRLDL